VCIGLKKAEFMRADVLFGLYSFVVSDVFIALSFNVTRLLVNGQQPCHMYTLSHWRSVTPPLNKKPSCR